MRGVDPRWRLTGCYEPLGDRHENYKDSEHAHAGPQFGHATSVQQRIARPDIGAGLVRQKRNQARSNRSVF